MIEEYGIDFTAPGALRAWDRATRPEERIKSPGHYAGAVRRLAKRLGIETGTDGRLLAVGYCHVTPRAFLAHLDQWLAYYDKATERPDRIGSCYNADPDRVWDCYRARIPAWVCRVTRGLAAVRTVRRRELRRLRWHLDIARAHQRSDRDTFVPVGMCSPRLQAMLGRLTPELQVVARSTLSWPPPGGRAKFMPKDVDWQVVSDEQARMLRSRAYTALWSQGKRREALWPKETYLQPYPEDVARVAKIHGRCHDEPIGAELYKCITSDLHSAHGGSWDWADYLPRLDDWGTEQPGPWTPARPVVLCHSGWHVTPDPTAWCHTGAVKIFEVEARGAAAWLLEDEKVAFEQVRLVRGHTTPEQRAVQLGIWS